MFEPTRDNCTIDGYSAKRNAMWDRMDWDKKEWRETSTLFDALVGKENAPPDPHWRVPHIDPHWGTYHRVRQKKRR